MFKRLINQYKSFPSPVKASIWYVGCSILQKGISFLTVPILTRLMPESEYGEYSVFMSWYQIVSIFATLNLQNYVLNNGMLKYERDRDGYISSLQGLSILTTLGLFFVYLLFSGVWEKTTSLSLTAMSVMFAELLVMPSFDYWCNRERFEYRYKGVVLFTLAISVAVPLVSIPLVVRSGDKGMAAILGRTLPSAMIYLIPAVMLAVKGRKFFDKRYWRFALQFNLPLIPHFLAGVILQQMDRIMISGMAGNDKAGIYSVAYSAAMVLQLMNGALLSSFIPYTYKGINAGKTNGIRRIANYILLMIAALNLALICVAPEAMKLLGPQEYWEAMYVIPPVAMSNVFMLLFNLFATIEYYYEETKFVTMASISSAVANVVLNWLCIPRFGYIAAGYTTLVCYILYSVGHYVFMRIVLKKHMDNKRIYNEKAILLIAIGAVLLSFAILALYDHPIIRYALVLTGGIVCIIKGEWIIEQIKEIRRRKA